MLRALGAGGGGGVAAEGWEEIKQMRKKEATRINTTDIWGQGCGSGSGGGGGCGGEGVIAEGAEGWGWGE